MSYRLETYPWRKQGGIAVCSTRADYDAALRGKLANTGLPYNEVEFHCNRGIVLAHVVWDVIQKKWV